MLIKMSQSEFKTIYQGYFTNIIIIIIIIANTYTELKNHRHFSKYFVSFSNF